MKPPRQLLIGAAICIGLLSLGAIKAYNLDNELRTHVVNISGYSPPGATASTVDAGSNGVVALRPMLQADSGTGDTQPVFTAAQIKPPPYAARLEIRINDLGDADTVQCAGFIVQGYDQFGNSVTETTGIVGSDGGTLTKYAYEAVSSIKPVGCYADSNGQDNIAVRTSAHVAVDRVLYADRDLVSVCVRSDGGTWTCAPGADCEQGAGTTVSGPYANAVDLASCGLTVAAGDSVMIRMRSETKR